MKASQNPKSGRRKSPVFNRIMKQKLAAVWVIVMLALAALLYRTYRIQDENNEEYSKIVLSQRQSEYSSSTILYKRGDIYDRNGNKLAQSERVYNLILDPRQMFEAEYTAEDGSKRRYVVEPTIDALCEYFGYDRGELSDMINDHSSSRYVIFQKSIDYDTKQGFLDYVDQKNAEFLKSEDAEVRKNQIKGVWFEDDYDRTYPYGSLACSVIGFSSADGTTGTGGVEQYYNDELTGTNGRRYGYLNDDANLERVIKPAQNGNTLVLTIDANIQSVVEKYLKEWQAGIGSLEAACIVMDPNTGEILAMADSDSFDLNNPRTREGYTEQEIYDLGLQECVYDYRAKHEGAEISLEEVPEHYERSEIVNKGTMAAWNQKWRNFCVSDAYEPGSTQKIFTVAGALEEGIINENDSFLCEGNLQFSGSGHTWRINCVNRNGHGPLDVTGGITNSCNVVMMDIALQEGEDIFLKYQHIFGFGGSTGVDLPAEGKGLGLDDPDIGKVDLATRSFGQNYTCTMIQMAAAYASIINGGSYYAPHVLDKIVDENGTVVREVEPTLVRETVSESTCDFIKNALFETVSTGTGGAAAVAGYHVGGKTGTAEKLPRSEENYVVSFCGFAPVEDPQLLCYVVIDQPDLVRQEQAHSSFASEIFSKIMAECLPMVGKYPEGVQASEYQAPSIALPETTESQSESESGTETEEGQSAASESGASGTETSESQETTSAQQTETAGEEETEISMEETRPPARDEYIQGDDGGSEDGGLPDMLSDLIGDEGIYQGPQGDASGEPEALSIDSSPGA